VTLVFESGGSVRGRVVRPAGRDGQSFWIAFQPTSGPGLPSSWTASDPRDASFVRDGLEAGTYTLIARTNDGLAGAIADVKVEAGHETSDVEIALTAGAKLTVLTEGNADPIDVELWSANRFFGRRALVAGEVWLELVPAGTYSLKRVDGRGAQRDDVALTPDEARTLTLRW
jgi:hypothetical protein